MANDQEIVRDEKVGQAKLVLQLIEHVDDLCLDGYVQRGNRLVTDDEIGIDREGSRDTDTLSLSAGELVRITCGVFAVQSDIAHQLKYTFMALLLGAIELMDVQRLTNDIRYGHTRIQGRIRILENHGRLLAEFFDIRLGFDLLSVVPDLAARGLIEM